IDEPPGEMFGKLMSISDDLMWRYFELLSFRASSEIEALRSAVAGGRNPMEVKFELASELVARFHDKAAAERAHADFIARYRHRETPEDLELAVITTTTPMLGIVQLLARSGLVDSTSEARRLIGQGGVSSDGVRISDPMAQIPVGSESVYKVGKRRFKRVRVVAEKDG